MYFSVLCVYFFFLARSLIWPSSLFLTELFLSFSTIDGRLSSPFPTTDGCVGTLWDLVSFSKFCHL